MLLEIPSLSRQPDAITEGISLFSSEGESFCSTREDDGPWCDDVACL